MSQDKEHSYITTQERDLVDETSNIFSPAQSEAQGISTTALLCGLQTAHTGLLYEQRIQCQCANTGILCSNLHLSSCIGPPRSSLSPAQPTQNEDFHTSERMVIAYDGVLDNVKTHTTEETVPAVSTSTTRVSCGLSDDGAGISRVRRKGKLKGKISRRNHHEESAQVEGFARVSTLDQRQRARPQPRLYFSDSYSPAPRAPQMEAPRDVEHNSVFTSYLIDAPMSICEREHDFSTVFSLLPCPNVVTHNPSLGLRSPVDWRPSLTSAEQQMLLKQAFDYPKMCTEQGVRTTPDQVLTQMGYLYVDSSKLPNKGIDGYISSHKAFEGGTVLSVWEAEQIGAVTPLGGCNALKRHFNIY